MLGSDQGTTQVAGINGLYLFIRQCLGYLLRLPQALRIQLNVNLSLNTRGYVPVGFAMANGEYVCGFHGKSVCNPVCTHVTKS